ncbi:MAG: DUF4348 domain-containing protein [Sporocytophaga sp.]|nr:DUF4348 domain-containing protein [Sporocytophaga sp.]
MKMIFKLFLGICLVACTNEKHSSSENLNRTASNTIEYFDSFSKRFYSDSLFQMSRIKFPLPGINTDDMDINDNSPYYWQKNKWKMLKAEGDDLTGFKIDLSKTDFTVTETITHPEYPGMIIESVFTLIKGKWYLTRYKDVNL